MSMAALLSFDDILASLIVCLTLREAFIIALPDRIAGPGGSFIDTDRG